MLLLLLSTAASAAVSTAAFLLRLAAPSPSGVTSSGGRVFNRLSPVIQGCASSALALGRCLGSRRRQCPKKSRSATDSESGSGGGPPACAIAKSAETCDPYFCDHGGFPVTISMTVQPTDHTSAALPAPVCLMTSGAIQ